MNTTSPVCLSIASKRLDAEGARTLLREAEGLQARGVQRVVVDLSGVHRIDSLGITALCAIAKKLGPGSRVALAGLTDTARTLARLTRLHEVFEIFATPDAAVKAMVS